MTPADFEPWANEAADMMGLRPNDDDADHDLLRCACEDFARSNYSLEEVQWALRSEIHGGEALTRWNLIQRIHWAIDDRRASERAARRRAELPAARMARADEARRAIESRDADLRRHRALPLKIRAKLRSEFERRFHRKPNPARRVTDLYLLLRIHGIPPEAQP